MDSTKIVGEKIKSLRETKEISVAELAVRSGLAEEQIERIENNVDLPSLAPLIKIARALGVRLGTFLDDQEEQGAVICRKQESEDTISFSNNAMDLRTHMRYHSLSKSKADRHMEPFIVDAEPTEETHFSLSSHEGEEFIYVMEGTIEVCHICEPPLDAAEDEAVTVSPRVILPLSSASVTSSSVSIFVTDAG